MKKIFYLIIILLVSGCLETPKGKLPSINQAEIDMEAERQKRVSYAKYIEQMSLVKSIGFKVNSSNADICNKTDFKSGLTFANENVMGLNIAKFFFVWIKKFIITKINNHPFLRISSRLIKDDFNLE